MTWPAKPERNIMTIIHDNQPDALACAVALMNAGRPCRIHRATNGDFEITTRD